MGLTAFKNHRRFLTFRLERGAFPACKRRAFQRCNRVRLLDNCNCQAFVNVPKRTLIASGKRPALQSKKAGSKTCFFTLNRSWK